MKSISKYFSIHTDKRYLQLSVLFFIIWLCCKGPLRILVANDLISNNFFIGIAPNFFAGITLVFWQTYITSSKQLVSFVSATIILVTGELLQTVMPTQTADVSDAIASVIGCGIAAGIVALRSRNVMMK